MKLPVLSRSVSTALGFFLPLAISTSLRAADLFWDGTDTTGDADGGDGTWNAANTNWDDAATGGNSTTWTDGENAIFGGAAGTVTVSGLLQTPLLDIDAGYTFTGGATDAINIGGGTVDSSSLGTTGATDVVMNAILAGSGGLTINAHGNLSATGADSGAEFRLGNGNGNGNTFSGGLEITGGLVSWTDDSSFGNAANTITLKNFGGLLDANQSQTLARNLIIDSTGGTIRSYGSSTLTISGQISGSGAINRTDGGTLILTNSSNSHSGTWNLQGGILRLNGGGSLGTATVNNGTRLDFFNDGTAAAYSNAITGAGLTRFESSAGTTYSGTFSGGGNIYVGDATDGASLTLASGADVTANLFYVGESGSTAGNVTQQAGTAVEVTNQLRIGHWGGETSTYTIEGGTLDLTGTPGGGFETAGVVILGVDGTGIFNQDGGTVTAAGVGLDVRTNTAGTDQYNLNAGSLILGSKGIGGNASSEFNLGGGTLQASAGFTSTKDWNVNSNSTFNANGQTVVQQGNITGTANLDLTSATGVLELNHGGAHSVSANLTGSGAVTKTGAGTATLSGASTYTGATSVSAGTLEITGSLGNTAVAVADGASLAGEGALGGSLTLGSSTGAGLVIDPNTGAHLNVTGAVTLNGPNSVSFSVGPQPTGSPINVFSHGGLTGTLGTDLVLAGGGANYRSEIWADSGGVVSVDLGNKNLTWNGSSGGEWDLKTSTRWNAAEADFFAWGDAVTFDDTGTATAVTLSGDLRPSAVTVDSNTNNYSFTGVIGGEGALLKDGSSTLTVNGASTYSGGTTISDGTIVVTGVNNGLGSGAITLGDANTGSGDVALLLTNARQLSNAIAVSSQAGGEAVLGFSGTGGNYTAFTGPVALERDVTIRSGTTDRLHFSNSISGTGDVTIDGGQRVTMSGNNSYDGDLLIRDSGTVYQTFGGNNIPDTATVDVGAGAEFRVYISEGVGAVAGSGLLRPVAGKPTLTLGNNDTAGDFAGTWTFNGSDHLNITKTGSGTQTFSGTVTSPGALTINGGTVAFTTAASFDRTNAPGTAMPTRALLGSGTLRAEAGGDVTLRRSSVDFTGAIQVAGGTLTVGHADAVGTASVSLDGGTLAFDNSGSYFTPISGQTLIGGTLTTDVTTVDYGTLHNTSGDVVPGSTTHAYHGQIYLTTGDWSFVKRFDDGGSVTIDGTTILNDGTWNATATGTYTAAADGWYDVDVRVAQGGGGVGPNGGWTTGIGIKQGAASTTEGDHVAFGDLAAMATLGSGLAVTNDVTFSRPLAVAGNSTIDTSAMVGTPGASGADGNGSFGDVTLTASLSGAGDLHKTGSGSLLLNANNSGFTGNLVIDGGTVRINNQVRGAAGITVNSGGRLETNATNIFVGGHGVPMPDAYVITVDGGTWEVTGSHDARFGNVVLSNGATWTSNRGLSGYDALLANTTAGAATVTVSGSGASVMDGPGGIHLQGIQNFAVADTTGDDAADLTVSMELGAQGITGGPAGGINKTGAGTMAIATRTSYTGGTTVDGGVLDLTGGGGSAGTIRGTATVNGGGTLRLSTGDATGYSTGSDRLDTINLVGGSLVVNTTSNQTLGSAVINLTGGSISGVAGSNLDFFQGASAINSLASATTSTVGGAQLGIRQSSGLTIDVADGAAATDLEISSVITNNGGFASAPLIKSGAGTLLLTGTNTHTGATDIQGGALALGASGSLANSPSVIVGASTTLDVTAHGGWTLGAAQTLSGMGTVAGATTIAGTLAPGSSPGTLSFTDDLGLGTGSLLELEIASLVSFDHLLVSGDFSTTGLDATVAITLLGDYNPDLGDSFQLVSAGSYSGLDPLFNFDSATLDPGESWDTSTFLTDGTIRVIPETRVPMLIGIMGALALVRRRRR